MSIPSRPLEPHEILTTLRRCPARWITPTIVLAALALIYAVFLHTPLWQARQSLLIRDEAASDLARDGRPGRFEGLDAMKTAQETVLELARSRAVVSAALEEIGPPAEARTTADWPTQRDVEKVQGRLQVKAPHGAEFGKTEVFCLFVKDPDRERSLVLTDAIARQLEHRLQLVRDRRAQSLVEELTRTVELARSDLEGATLRLSEVERSVGGDLAELRMLSEVVGGESNLRMSLTAVKNDLRAARVSQRNHQQLLQLLWVAQQDPLHLLATPNHLLVSQPALQRLKDGLVDAQLASARLQGNMTTAHPLVQAASQSEAEIRGHLHREIAVAIRGIQAEIDLDAGRIAMLEEQVQEINARMERLAGMRAYYANTASEVQHFHEILKKAQQDLAAVRASRAAAGTASLLTRLEDPYTGSNPTGPSRAMIVLAGLLGGLATGLGWVFLVPPPRPVETHDFASRGMQAIAESVQVDWSQTSAPAVRLPDEPLASLPQDWPPMPTPKPQPNTASAPVQNSPLAAEEPVRVLSLKQALARLSGDRASWN